MSIIGEREGEFCSVLNMPLGKFEEETLFINTLEEPRAKGGVNRHGG
jgi:hypothetical protein